MKRTLFVLAVLLLVAFPVVTVSAQMPSIVSVSVATLNVRDGPGLNFDVIGRVYRGTLLQVQGWSLEYDWLHICCTAAGDDGWVYAAYTRAWSPPDLPASTPVPPPPPVCDCSYNRYNCSSFATQRGAQVCFNYCLRVTGYDVHWLDADRDGVACEWNPR